MSYALRWIAPFILGLIGGSIAERELSPVYCFKPGEVWNCFINSKSEVGRAMAQDLKGSRMPVWGYEPPPEEK